MLGRGLRRQGQGQRQPFFPVTHPLAQPGVLAQQACEPASRARARRPRNPRPGGLADRGRCSSFHAPLEPLQAAAYPALYRSQRRVQARRDVGCARSSKNAIAMATRCGPSSSPMQPARRLPSRLAARRPAGQGSRRRRPASARRPGRAAPDPGDAGGRCSGCARCGSSRSWAGFGQAGTVRPVARSRENTPAARPRPRPGLSTYVWRAHIDAGTLGGTAPQRGFALGACASKACRCWTSVIVSLEQDEAGYSIPARRARVTRVTLFPRTTMAAMSGPRVAARPFESHPGGGRQSWTRNSGWSAGAKGVPTFTRRG